MKNDFVPSSESKWIVARIYSFSQPWSQFSPCLFGKGSQIATKAISHVLTDFFSCFPKVCRVAYEIMQTLHPDASANFHSLDDIYYFGGQNAHNQIAIYPHEPRTADEIPMEPGDIIGVAGNHWDGYSKGVNRKLGRTGLYPSYKVREKIETVKYPTYPEAEK